MRRVYLDVPRRRIQAASPVDDPVHRRVDASELDGFRERPGKIAAQGRAAPAPQAGGPHQAEQSEGTGHTQQAALQAEHRMHPEHPCQWATEGNQAAHQLRSTYRHGAAEFGKAEPGGERAEDTGQAAHRLRHPHHLALFIAPGPA